MGDSWAEASRRHKRAQQDPGFEGEGAPARYSRRKGKPAGRKVLLDRLGAARDSLLRYEEWMAERGSDSWWVSGRDWAKKRYAQALKACHDAGIEINA